LSFRDSSGKVWGESTTGADGGYSVSLEPSESAYTMAVNHAEYQEKYIDEIHPPFRDISLAERRQLAGMASRARPWVGNAGLAVRRDFVMIPKDLGN
jgi:hypothetical protein